MENINRDLIENLEKLNRNLIDKIKNSNFYDKKTLRDKMEGYGEFINLKKLSNTEISKFSPMACVDGSFNKYGGSYPNFLYIFQGLSKVSESNKNIYKVSTYSPLLSETKVDIEEEIENEKLELTKSKKNLAEIELDVAIETCKTENIKFLLMDGNLIRYYIEAKEKYNELVQITRDNNIILAGFIKEAKTNAIYDLVSTKKDETIMDKDLLFGVLEYGECYILDKDFNKKIENGIISILLRTSDYPGISAIEILEQDEKYLETISNLCFSMTLKSSRGVPMIIDIVDREVKLDNKITESLVKANIDKDLIERFFTTERSMRRL